MSDTAASRPQAALWNRCLLIGAAVSTLAFFVVLQTDVLGRRASVAFDDATLCLLPGLAAAACWRAGRRDGESRRAWSLLAVAVGCWSLGGASWFVDEVLRGTEVPFPSLADVGYLGMPVFAVLALVAFSGAGRRLGLRSILDGAIASAAFLFLSWVTVLGPTLSTSDGDLLPRLVALAYPVADVTLATVALLAMARVTRARRATLLLLTLGLIGLAAADTGFLWLVIQGRYQDPGVWTDTGFFAVFALIGTAGLWRPSTGLDPTGSRTVVAQLTDADVSRWSLLLVYVPVALALPLWFALQLVGRPLGVVAACLSLVTVIAVLLRQLLSVQLVASLSGELRHLTLHDPLTGLANRVLLADRVAHGLARRRTGPLVLVLADLDDFKAVNDTMGHQAGDVLLVEVAQRLRGAICADDTVARLGGDEFAVLLESAGSVAEAQLVGQRIVEALRHPVSLNGVRAVVGASVGMAIASDGTTAAELLRDADIAMYAAKADGKNRVHLYEPGLVAAELAHRELRDDLAVALAEGQLSLKYQAITDLTSGAVVGVEALLRWNHPVHGDVPPGQFIPLAEASGDIIQIGRWVIQQACAAAGRWHRLRAAGQPPLRVSVNVSGHQFADPGLVSTVTSALHVAGLPPELLCLEITESMLVALPEAVPPLRSLRALGAHLAIDDFGTGHSTLSRLRDYPVDCLKIDRSFVTALSDADDQTHHAEVLITAILTMGHGLGMAVVAEGIENDDQLAVLRALGCDHGQGFLIARPADPEVIDELVRSPIPLLDLATPTDTDRVQ